MNDTTQITRPAPAPATVQKEAHRPPLSPPSTAAETLKDETSAGRPGTRLGYPLRIAKHGIGVKGLL